MIHTKIPREDTCVLALDTRAWDRERCDPRRALKRRNNLMKVVQEVDIIPGILSAGEASLGNHSFQLQHSDINPLYP